MSIEAVSWALSTKRVATPMQRLVLIAVANHADKRGQSAWPSQETLAEYCCCSSRTIRRQLSELEESGIIRRGDQRLVSHFRGGYRPVVYDVDLGGDEPVDNSDEPVDNSDEPVDNSGGDRTSATDLRPDNLSRLDTGVHRGRTSATLRPDTGVLRTVLEPSIEPSISNSLPSCASDPVDNSAASCTAVAALGDPQAGTPTQTKPSKRQLDDEFEKFWSLVARKRGKQQARKSFEKQRRTHDLEFICSQLMKAQDEWLRMGREPEYWPHPSTWLNQQLEDDYDTVRMPSQQEFYEARVQMLREQHMREKDQLNAVTGDASMTAITSTCIDEDDEDDDDDWDWGA
nr:MAG TPA: helix-turn-helix domain protein [Caudoviricetes sp.]